MIAYKKIALTLTCLFCLDLVYLSFMKNTFNRLIRSIQGTDLLVNMTSAVFCYYILGMGLYTFVIKEGRKPVYAFLLGLFVYGVYETTTKALLKKWPWSIVVLDTLWGGVLFALTTWIVGKILM